MNMSRCTLLLSLLACLLLCACGPSNTVRLTPLKPAVSVLPAPTASTIAVVQFADKRADSSALGTRRDGSYFSTIDSATDWVSRSVANQLGTLGYQVSFAMSTAQALKANPNYIVTGSLEELKVKESSSTSYESSIRLKYAVQAQNKVVATETLSASQSKTAILSGSAVESLLTDTLKDITGPLCDKVKGIVR